MSYADGYLGQWEDYLDMMEPAISAVPFLIGDGNHESGAMRHALSRPVLSNSLSR